MLYYLQFFCEGGEVRMRTQKKPPIKKKKKKHNNHSKKIEIWGDSNPLLNEIATLYSSPSERQFKNVQSKMSQNKKNFQIQNPSCESDWKFESENE
jgi:hypothetical protein